MLRSLYKPYEKLRKELKKKRNEKFLGLNQCFILQTSSKDSVPIQTSSCWERQTLKTTSHRANYCNIVYVLVAEEDARILWRLRNPEEKQTIAWLNQCFILQISSKDSVPIQTSSCWERQTLKTYSHRANYCNKVYVLVAEEDARIL